VRIWWGLAALAAICGCLGAPGPASPPADGGGDKADAASAGSDGAPGRGCADAFAVSYVSQLDVPQNGGELTGMLVIEALGDGVVLTELIDAGDDNPLVELELVDPSYSQVPAGQAFGALAAQPEELIIGPLVAPDAWTDPIAPSFRLAFSAADADELSQQVTAALEIGGARAELVIDVSYDPENNSAAVPVAAARVAAVCGG
jgi:hypothetical protein